MSDAGRQLEPAGAEGKQIRTENEYCEGVEVGKYGQTPEAFENTPLYLGWDTGFMSTLSRKGR